MLLDVKERTQKVDATPTLQCRVNDFTFEKLGYRSTKTLYRLLNRDVLEDYVYLEKSGRVFLILEPPNLPTLSEKIKANIQVRRNNIIKCASSKCFIYLDYFFQSRNV